MKSLKILTLVAICSSLTFCGGKSNSKSHTTEQQTAKAKVDIPAFDRDSAYQYIASQVRFGARVPGSKAHQECMTYLSNTLKNFGAEVTIQEGKGTLYTGKEVDIKNIVGSFNTKAQRRILLTAHWDSRPFADQDPDPKKHNKPILGANDGASGVGVLLEVSRHLHALPKDLGIDIIFFDVEDYGTPSFYKGKYDEDSWCIGSKYWAKNPHKDGYKAEFGILLDMVGGINAKFYKEYFSMLYARNVVDKVWQKAIKSGFDGYFISQIGGQRMDDHIAINEHRKIPTIDIIDYNPNNMTGFNQHWHTSKDDMNNIDKNSLYSVGQTLLNIIFE